MELTLFDVNHGACALLTTDDNKRIMIDCGDNQETGWSPGDHLGSLGVTYLDMLVVTNYDDDHMRGLPELLDGVEVGWLYRNRSVTPDVLRNIKREYGISAGIESLISMMDRYTSGPESIELPAFLGVKYAAFHNYYPAFEDTNNLSMVLKLTVNGVGFLFPGDLEKAGWKALLERDPGFREAVKKLSVLVASHHGRENGLHPELFTQYGCNPYWIAISDKGHEHETQETVQAYAKHARGGYFRGETRYVLTTRNDGHITFAFEDGSWRALGNTTQQRRYNIV